MKFAVTDLLPFIVTLTGLAEPDAPPVQLTKRNPAVGVAVSATTTPLSYVPLAGLIVPPPTGDTVVANEYRWMKLAVTDLLAFMVTLTGFVEPVAPPVQFTKR